MYQILTFLDYVSVHVTAKHNIQAFCIISVYSNQDPPSLGKTLHMHIMNTIKRVGEASYINQYIFILHFQYSDTCTEYFVF